MKKILLSAIAVFAFSFANAQEESDFGFSKGDVLVEGNLSLTSKSVPDGNSTKTTTSYGFAPVGGYFLSDNFALGLGLNISSDKENSREVNTFGVGVFGRYYFLELGQRFKVYGQAGLGFDSINDKVADAKSTEFGFHAGLGMNYFLTKSFAINFGLTDIFSVVNNKPKNGDGTTTVNFNVNKFNNFFTTPTFGLSFRF
ncbi:outer membrane beta-barrel protein [Capnocytophaga sp. oral taxon 338]|uniref:outer membrane beta-barrel protein n=1 Tax=Capnocytophaga sp. oral taxon 338 TaxID=710239 RepID=UPI000202BFF5|nr:outer membrane beta-barrel protein [Capnocytophaga sp. oral taxon 338]EGD34661.1 hypothetical protein HMPREF9071_0852 [Capnocytophaga sp. oral taxon 338 str. F0234]